MKKVKACDVCLRNCVRLHGDEAYDAEDEIPPAGSSGPRSKEDGIAVQPFTSFLMKVTDLLITSALKLPGLFVKHFGSRISSEVTLEEPGNKTWLVQIRHCEEKDSLEFGGGWPEFAEYHFLQIGDQLSFTLSAESRFHVVVYDESGSQKISAPGAIDLPLLRLQDANALKVDQGELSVPFRNKPGPRPKQKVRRRPRTECVVSPVELDVSIAIAHDSKDLIELRNIDASKEENHEETASNVKSHNNEELDTGDTCDTGDACSHPLLPPHVLVDGHVISQRRAVTQAEKHRALIAACALPITNPKLVMVMAKGYVYKGFWMAIKKSFAHAQLPKETREITLLNLAGHKWTVKWLYKAEGSSGFSGGWRGFALDHRLEEGDVCVFEMVDQKNYVLVVHIVRVLGGPGEDTRDYNCTSGRNRVANWMKIPSGVKRKLEATDSFHPGSSSVKKSCFSPGGYAFQPHAPGTSSQKCCGSPGKYKAPIRCTKIEEQEIPPSETLQDKESKPATYGGDDEHSPDFVPDETPQSGQHMKKTKSSSSASVGSEEVKIAEPIN